MKQLEDKNDGLESEVRLLGKENQELRLREEDLKANIGIWREKYTNFDQESKWKKLTSEHRHAHPDQKEQQP